MLPCRNFEVSFLVTNTGSTPFYYSWPVELSLLDPQTRLPVWRENFQGVDIRDWLPGDLWEYSDPTVPGSGFGIPPGEYQVTGVFNIPEEIPAGPYILALAVLDPSGMEPALRFAVENYFEGGRHPLGMIGVDHEIDDPYIDPVQFDDPGTDHDLSYQYPVPPALQVHEPSGNQVWISGGQYPVVWESWGVQENLAIDFSYDGGSSWLPLVDSTPDDGAETITAPQGPGDQCRVRVRTASSSCTDISNADFFLSTASPVTGSFHGDGGFTVLPNPFNPRTSIGYDLPAEGRVKLEVYDLRGARLAVLVDEVQGKGLHQVVFDGTGLASGVYRCRLRIGNREMVQSMTIVR